MYKVFVNDRSLFLTNEVQKETDFQIFLLESIDIKKLIVKMYQNKIQDVFLYHPDEKLIMKTLKAKIPTVKAGGGLVYNAKGKILFIFRNGKWDLPKGGTEKNETMEETAMREVEEETGIVLNELLNVDVMTFFDPINLNFQFSHASGGFLFSSSFSLSLSFILGRCGGVYDLKY